MGVVIFDRPHFLEFHRCQYLVPAGYVALIIVVDLLTVLYTGAHHIRHIYDRHTLTYIMCYRCMPESVGVQRKRTTQCLTDFFEPVVQIPYKVFYVTIIGGLSF